MPTIILLDVSLSMAKPSHRDNLNHSDIHSAEAQDLSNGGAVTKKALAVHSVYTFLDALSIQAKLEYVSLVR